MLGFLIRRLGISIVLIVCVATLVFSLMHMMPGDPVLLILGSNPNQEAIDAFRKALGLNRPLLEQYSEWMRGLLTFDLGNSLRNRESVGRLVTDRLPRTFELIAFAFVLAALIGMPLGIHAATRAGTIADTTTTIAGVLGMSIPNFVVGIVLIVLFAITWRVLPSGGYSLVSRGLADHLKRLLLPGVTLSIPLAAVTMRMTRSSMLETMEKEFVRTARSKGLREQRVLVKHVLRLAMIPVSSLLGAEIAALFGGTVIVEQIFFWPGLSTLLVTAAHSRDYPVVQGAIVTIAMLLVTLNLVVDIGISMLDPRIRLD